MRDGLKYTKENQELRRGRVAELSARGYNQSEIAKILNVSVSLISIDMQYIRAQAKENIRNLIQDKLPEEYDRCLTGLNSILKESWTLSLKTEDTREKIQALSLAKQCYDAKLDLLTNVDVIEDVIKFVNKGKEGSISAASVTEPQQEDSNSSEQELSGSDEELSREYEEQQEEEEEQDVSRE